MENLTVTGMRSRSRSKTPFLRSSCDRENCLEVEEHTHHKSGRKTPVSRSTPVKHLVQPTVISTETITEVTEEYTSPPAHRTRQSTKIANQKLVKTSDYSSEESLDRLKSDHRKEILQNDINNQYERVSTSTNKCSSFTDFTLSPISTSQNVTRDRSSRIGSPTYSACSTDSSFAEQALADTSVLLDRDPRGEHLPSRLYKMAGEYWNKYPKTDYTYSRLSKDRVELAPGQVAMPNMSRRSLSQFRIQGPTTSVDEIDRLSATTSWTSNTVRKRYTAKIDSSDDESAYIHPNGAYTKADNRWWITRFLMTIITTITTATSEVYNTVVGPPVRYPYRDRRATQTGIVSRTASAAAAPFVWIYTTIKNVITTTITTVTETITPNHMAEREIGKFRSSSYQATRTVAKRSWWPWALLLLLPAIGYGSHYTYENWDHLAMPNFTNFRLDLSEFSAVQLPEMSMPNIKLTELLPKINLTLPEINITLPDITDNLPEVKKTYVEYKDIVQNRASDASDYMKVVAESCFEELRRLWRGVIG